VLIVPTFLEFFAGGGMARAGLAPDWRSIWANDFCPSKAAIYAHNWGEENLHLGDVGQVTPQMLPSADMAWGSFPCQDLSLAGEQRGIGTDGAEEATRSGTFWNFWRLVRAKAPALVVLENVVGTLTSNQGRDIGTILQTVISSGYRIGPLVLDAALWVPQSRPRLFLVAVHERYFVPGMYSTDGPSGPWHTDAVCRVFASIPAPQRASWVWWNLPNPTEKKISLSQIIETHPSRWVTWDSPEKTDYLLGMMSETNRKKLADAQSFGRRIIGLGYRRTREGRQRLEVRFDGLAGCLRTAGGGSSKQIVIEVTGPKVRSRLLSPREAARLQGLPDDYWLPDSYNEAYDLVGDGLCVPVVAYLGRSLLTPLHQSITSAEQMTA
jgi:DNA (cytosine-5)-methyltransferase 1